MGLINWPRGTRLMNSAYHLISVSPPLPSAGGAYPLSVALAASGSPDVRFWTFGDFLRCPLFHGLRRTSGHRAQLIGAPDL
jgi:hypothetical protein